MTMAKFGITEQGDAALDRSWENKAGSFDGVVLITKAPHKLISKPLPGNAIVHCTITGFGGSVLEPGVSRPPETLDAYHQLVDAIGPERTVLRIDPIIPTEKGLLAAQKIFSEAHSRTRISFLDHYPSVRKRFKEAGLPDLHPGENNLHYPRDVRRKAAKLFPDAEICGEPGLDCTGCISHFDYYALDIPIPADFGLKRQRAACNCLAQKTELLSKKGRCAHGCLYCYYGLG